MEPIISLAHVDKEYELGRSAVRALRNISLVLERGRSYAITGPSGSGKSTLMHLMGGMDFPTRGQIRIAGKDLAGMGDAELTALRGRVIGFVFQAFHLNPVLNVEENVAIALRLLGVPSHEANRRAKVCLEKVGLGHRLRHAVNELSGGERQRVAIARAIVKRPSLILADEPTGNLDSESGRQVMDLFRAIHLEDGVTLAVVTHNHELAAQCEIVLTMRDGRMSEKE
jgi:putative ABC transport system ATP-binding protein